MNDMDEAIIGRLIDSPNLIETTEMDKTLFESEKHRCIFSAIKKLNKEKQKIDMVEISNITGYKISDLLKLTEGLHKIPPENFINHVNGLRKNKLSKDIFKEVEKQRKFQEKRMEVDWIQTKNLLAGFEQLDHGGQRIEIETLKSLYSSDVPKREVLVDPVIGKKEIIVLSGLPKSGKSILALNLAFCLAKGENWLDFAIDNPARVLIFQQEISRESYKERISIMLPSERDLKSLEDISINKERGLTIDTTQGLLAFSKAIESFQPELVIIDPFTDFHSKKENVTEEMSAMFKTLKSVVDKYGITIFIVHHFSKVNPEERQKVYMARGSSVISASPDSIWTLKYLARNKFDNMEDEDFQKTVELSFELRNTNPIRPLTIKRNDRLWYEITEITKRVKIDVDDIIEEIKKAGGEIYQSDLEQKFKDRGSHRTFIKAIEKAEQSEFVDSSIIEGSPGNSKVLFLKVAV